MNSAAEHYDRHLGRVYAWMVGNLDSAQQRAGAELADMGIGAPAAGLTAVDLGAGLGLHAAALGNLGYRVLAIEGCEPLLASLRERCAGLPVQGLHGDLAGFAGHLDSPASVILCLGDTLTHLASPAAVEQLLDSVGHTLAPGGVFAASFRDYATRELQGDQRYILVRRDEQRVLTCFLEYAAAHVTVHDILTERQGAGWTQTQSSYRKLRLAPSHIAAGLGARGLQVRIETAPAGMVRVVASRPA